MRRRVSLSHLRRFLIKAIATVFVLLIMSVAGYAVSKTTTGNGNWNVSGLWNPSGVPTVADDVAVASNNNIIINSGEQYAINSLIINGKLTVNGTLMVNDDLSTDVDGELIMGPNATVIVKGNVVLGNKCTLDLSSYFIVLGSFTKSGAANQGSISADNAHIYILGTTSTPYTYFSVCDSYSGNTVNTGSSCDGGTFEALISNETNNSNPVISDIVQDAITASTVPVDNLTPVSSCFCSGSSTTLTISDVNSISVLKWYNGATLLSTTTTPAQPYNLSVSQTGTYSALYKIGTTWYQTNSAEITSVAVPTAVISGTTTVCQGESATLSVALTGSGPWNFTYTDGTTSQTVTNQSTSPYTVTVGPASTKTYTLTSLNTACCAGTVSGSATITVAEILVPGAVSGGNSPICQGSSTGTLTLSNYSGTIVRWERQVNSGGWTSVGNRGNATYSEIPYSAGTWQYRAVVQSGGCGEVPSSSVSIEVDPTTVGGGIYTGNTPICEGASTGTMHLTGYTGSVVRWEKRVDGGTWKNIENTTDSYAEVPSSSGVWEYRALVQSGACSAVYSGSFMVAVNPTLTITFDSNLVAHQRQTLTALSYSATTGNPAGWILNFDDASNPGHIDDQNGGLGTTPGTISINIPYDASPGNYQATLTVISYYPACSSVDYPVTVTINSLASASISGNNGPICSGSNASFYLSGTSGATVTYNVNGGATATTVLDGGAATITVYQVVSDQTLNLESVVYGGYSQNLNTSSTILVNSAPIPAFSEAPGANECQNDDVVYTTQPGQSNYVWVISGTVGTDYSITSGGIGSNNNTVTIKWLSAGNKTVTVNYSNSDGCPGESPATSTVTIDPIPKIGSFN